MYCFAKAISDYCDYDDGGSGDDDGDDDDKVDYAFVYAGVIDVITISMC